MLINRAAETEARREEQQQPPAPPDTSAMTPQQRVLGRDEIAAAHIDRVARSTVADHGQAVEAMIELAIEAYLKKNAAYVAYLNPSEPKPKGGRKLRPANRQALTRKGGTPGYEARSPAWREAHTLWTGIYTALATYLGWLYPDPALPKPAPALLETQALIDRRVGKLCNGWTDETSGELVHHPEDVCPKHHVI